MLTVAGNEQLFHPSIPSKDLSFPYFDRKWTDLIRHRWTSKCPFSLRNFILPTNSHPYLGLTKIKGQKVRKLIPYDQISREKMTIKEKYSSHFMQISSNTSSLVFFFIQMSSY